MALSPPQTHVQRGFEPENEGFVTPREQTPYLASLFRYTSAFNARDFDTITDVFDSQVRHTFLPSCLQRPVLNYDKYFKYLDDITEMFLEFRVRISEIIEAGHKMTVQMTASGKGRSQRNYLNDIVMIIYFEKISSRDVRKYGSNGSNWPGEALPKMVDVREFVDSLSTKTFFMEERQWMKENGEVVVEQRSRGEGEWKKEKWRRRQQQNLPTIQTTMPLGYSGRHTSSFSPSGASGSPSSMYPPGATTGYQFTHPSAFPPGGGFASSSGSRSHGQASGTRGYQPSNSLGTAGQQSLQYTRPSSGYPGSYHPQSKDSKQSGN